MVSLKRSIAAIIVCFKPHVLLTLCILLVIAHSIVIAVQRGASNSWRIGKQHDFTLTMTTLILIVALIWAAFFIFIVRFELRNELESLLILFQCSKRGLRFLGVVGFHVALLAIVSFIVSATVERSIPPSEHQSSLTSRRYQQRFVTSSSSSSSSGNVSETTPTVGDFFLVAQEADYFDRDTAVDYKRRSRFLHPSDGGTAQKRARANTGANAARNKTDRDYLLTVYKIWLTAIVYAFLYLVIENLVMFYADMSLVEFVHFAFLSVVAKTTGIDLSDYPAGEMLFNPLVRHRIR